MLKKSKKVLKKIFSKHKLKKERKNIKKTDIINDLKNLGIKNRDIVLLHSSLKSIGYVIGGAKTVIEAILEVIGKEGTLVVPTYPRRGSMYDTCKMEGYIFDYKKSPTAMGAIPSEFLKIKEIHRSIHPTHSISAIGKYAKQIVEEHHLGDKMFGKNSPWGKIIELNGKILGVGITLGPTTQYHHVEDIMGKDFPIRVKVDKTFRLKCKIDNDKYIYVNVNPLDPEVSKTRIDKKESSFIRTYFWEIYKNLGILKIGKVGEAQSWCANAKKFCDILIKLAKLKITIYSTEEELKKNNLYPYKLIENNLRVDNYEF